MKIFKNSSIKLVAVLSVLAATLMSVSQLYAYGPEREETFTMDHPADYVTFNSITDNPELGDERNFVRIAEDGSGGAYRDDIKIEPGKTYELYIGYHNNAKDSLNKSGVGIARGVKLSVQYPTSVTPSKQETISAIISATNAKPQEVWDEVHLTSDIDVTLSYVVGSAKIYNSWGTNGQTLSTDIFSESGTYLGLNELDGMLPGCAKYSGHILIKFKADRASSEVTKTASLDGVNFSKSVSAKPGDEVTFKIEFRNTGTTDLTNVTFHDELPDTLTLVDGTTYLKYSTEDTPILITDLIASNGYNTGKYGPGTGATITYRVKVKDDYELCEKIVNKVFVDHDNGELTDSSTIDIVDDNCGDTPPPPETPEDPETPNELPNTGPLEIIMAILVVAGICGGGYYFYRSRKNLNKVEKKAKGKKSPKEQSEAELKPEGENIAETTEPKPTDEIKK